MRILFQGDSITDAGRNYNDDSFLGYGYPRLVEAELGFDFPKKYEFIDKGISGNRIVDLYARIKADIINLKPDVMSILIGVNDVWHELSRQNGVDNDKFYKVYSMLIEEVKEALPDIKIIIFEPFVLKAPRTIEDGYEVFRSEVEKRAESARKVAEKFNLKFVPLQKKFDDLTEKTNDATYWLGDGVHPTAKGHEFLKREWIKAFNSL